MRWLFVAILAYTCLIIETAAFRPGGLAVQVDGHWVRPDMMLLVGMFLAFFFEPRHVFVAGWGLGLASDIVSVAGRLGLKALLFCLALYLVTYARTVISRTRPLTQFLVCLVVVFAVHLVWYVTTLLVSGAGLSPVRSAEASALDALYSAVLAPYLFWLMLLLRSPLGIVAAESRR